MKNVVILLVAALFITGHLSCSKSSSSSGGGNGDYNPPPDPQSTGEIKGLLTYSNGSTYLLNATGNYTFFTRLIYTNVGDTVISISGSLDNKMSSVTIRLVNISSPGSYPFSNQLTPRSRSYAICEYYGTPLGNLYSTVPMTTDAGTVVIQDISSISVTGTFNSVVQHESGDRI